MLPVPWPLVELVRWPSPEHLSTSKQYELDHPIGNARVPTPPPGIVWPVVRSSCAIAYRSPILDGLPLTRRALPYTRVGKVRTFSLTPHDSVKAYEAFFGRRDLREFNELGTPTSTADFYLTALNS